MTNGDCLALKSLPCVTTPLHRGSDAFASQMYAYHALPSFSKGKVSFVVVDTVASAPLAVKDETAHRFEIPPPQSGTAPEFAVGVLLALQMMR
jgi:hypothetical protein